MLAHDICDLADFGKPTILSQLHFEKHRFNKSTDVAMVLSC